MRSRQRMLFLMLLSFPFIARVGRISRKMKRTLSNPSRRLVWAAGYSSSDAVFRGPLIRVKAIREHKAPETRRRLLWPAGAWRGNLDAQHLLRSCHLAHSLHAEPTRRHDV